MKVASIETKFALQRFANFAQTLRRRTNAQTERLAQVRDERRFADAFRAKNQDVFALRVQPLEQRNFLGTTDKWQRDVHGSPRIHRPVISQNTSSITTQAGRVQFAKEYRNRSQ